MFGHAKVLLLAGVIVLAGCAGKQSESMVGGNLFAQWCPTDEQLVADPSLQPIRWTHAESMQFGSFVSGVWEQVGENPPMLVEGSLTTQAGPVNAALGAGGLIGAAVLFNPDPDQTTVNQKGGGAEANSDSKSAAGALAHADADARSKSDSKSAAGAIAIIKPKKGHGPRD